MHSYAQLRPDTAAYGPWRANARRGTITDDSRHKIILMRSLRKMLADHRDRLTRQDLARQFVAFRPHEDREPDEALAVLVDEGLREYRYASRWLLGERDPAKAAASRAVMVRHRKLQRANGATSAGGRFSGRARFGVPRNVWIDFVDAPGARDIAAALNAGLAAVLDPELDAATVNQRWDRLLVAMRETDPYRLRQVPFAGRPLDRWLDLADSIVKRSQGRPARAYELLESEGKPVYYWDAHFTLLVPLTMLKFCEFDPLAAMHLTLDFGHDTDSYAQVLGAMAGAVHGTNIFPVSMRTDVEARFLDDYGESIDQWVKTLSEAAGVWSDLPAE